MNKNSVKLDIPTSSLIYDTDSIALIGQYKDELSAYRARRKWTETLSNYFLLENEKDFSLKIVPSQTSSYFLLECLFSSACGRYAFWRLINYQAPEAEDELNLAKDCPWVMTEGASQPIERKISLKQKISNLFTSISTPR